MSNVFGHQFRVMTFGESHGPALGAVIDGCPAGVPFESHHVERQLLRDRAIEALATSRREPNRFEVLSGVLEGKTLGTPVAIVIRNADARADGYPERTGLPRPGHGELTWMARFDVLDWRGGGRASGRECAARVAAAALARQILQACGIEVTSVVTELAGLPVETQADRDHAYARVAEIAKAGDSSGGVFEVAVRGAPAGLGAPVFAKLKAELPAAIFSIGAVSYVALGDGLDAPTSTASTWNDAIVAEDGRVGTATNRCGGLLGGLSTGETLRLQVGVKPPPSVRLPQRTVDLASGEAREINVTGRFDINATPRVAVVAEAMTALVLVDHLLLGGFVHPTRFALSRLLAGAADSRP